MTYTIEVRQSDIKACRTGKFAGGFYQCPIELAAQRALRQKVMCLGIEVLANADYDTICELPPEAQAFAEAYDKGEKVQPLTFEVRVGQA